MITFISHQSLFSLGFYVNILHIFENASQFVDSRGTAGSTLPEHIHKLLQLLLRELQKNIVRPLPYTHKITPI